MSIFRLHIIKIYLDELKAYILCFLQDRMKKLVYEIFFHQTFKKEICATIIL